MTSLRPWLTVLCFALFVFVIFFGYTLARQAVFPLVVNTPLAYTGIFLITSSFAVGNLSYFFPLFQRFVKYRRQLGVVGFGVIILHITVVLTLLADIFPFPSSFLKGMFLYSFLAALTAVCIYTMMTSISNNTAIKKLGGKRWRTLLRVGYVALILSLFHMFIRELDSLGQWIKNMTSLPPLSLFLLWFGVWTILLRVAIYFLKEKKG